MSSWGSSGDSTNSSSSDSGSSKPDPLEGRRPRNLTPYEVQISKDALQRRIDAGDITQKDIDLITGSFRTITFGMFGTGTVSFFGTLWFLRRRVPRPGPLFRWFAATSMGGLGMFLGFTVAGAATTYELHKNLPDAQHKMKVLQQISIDTKRAIVEHRMGIPTGTVIEHRAGVPETDRLITVDQYRGTGGSGGVNKYQTEDESVTPDVRNAVDTLDTIDEASSARTGVMGEIAKVDQPPSWEKLRTTRPARRGPAGQPGAVNLSPEDELKKRQAEFDAMLDRERKGGNDGDKW
ncbi:uncharacterized protein LOC62_06G008596 [Vanrija pseudolonga]|uniref:Uncharacterized protein n=1 Tax=Vanrija pseudolonga TaxID=143232 RepID=A0AAF0YGD4_9TREE|nr:hypothetical protein LOC62_06G008596 [Vanrija pseudolonga]